MKVVLLERVENLGAIGDVVTVKDGFARNFLLPRDKARRATEANLKAFELERAAIEARNDKNKAEAQKTADKIDGQTYVMIRQAGETGQLYGSVAGRDVAETVQAAGAKIEKSQVVLHVPIKTLGVHEVQVRLHAEVRATVKINVARSADEAERQAKGEDVIASQFDDERQAASDQAKDLLDGGAGQHEGLLRRRGLILLDRVIETTARRAFSAPFFVVYAQASPFREQAMSRIVLAAIAAFVVSLAALPAFAQDGRMTVAAFLETAAWHSAQSHRNASGRHPPADGRDPDRRPYRPRRAGRRPQRRPHPAHLHARPGQHEPRRPAGALQRHPRQSPQHHRDPGGARMDGRRTPLPGLTVPDRKDEIRAVHRRAELIPGLLDVRP